MYSKDLRIYGKTKRTFVFVERKSFWKCVRSCFWDGLRYEPGQLVEVKAGSEIPHHFECVTKLLFCEKCNPHADLAWLYNIRRLAVRAGCFECKKITDCLEVELFAVGKEEYELERGEGDEGHKDRGC